MTKILDFFSKSFMDGYYTAVNNDTYTSIKWKLVLITLGRHNS